MFNGSKKFKAYVFNQYSDIEYTSIVSSKGEQNQKTKTLTQKYLNLTRHLN